MVPLVYLGLFDFPVLERTGRKGLRVPSSSARFLITRKATVVRLNFGGLHLLCHAPMIAKTMSRS